MTTKKELRKAFEELIQVLELTETDGESIIIPPDANEDYLEMNIKEAIELIEFGKDVFTTKTQMIIDYFIDQVENSKPMPVEKKQEKSKTKFSNLITEINGINSIDDLLIIAQEEEIFKNYIDDFFTYKNTDELKERMLWVIENPDKHEPKTVLEIKKELEDDIQLTNQIQDTIQKENEKNKKKKVDFEKIEGAPLTSRFLLPTAY